jgi:mono/diheme cytochrome c family protein
MAPPVTYLVGGVQYITLMVGWGGAAGLVNPRGEEPIKPGFGRVLTFANGGNAKLEVPPFGHQGPPSPAIHINATQATVHEGAILYGTFCFYCHGVNVVAGASIPDLRYASAQTHQQFEAIVLGGARESRGMPSFKDALKRDQIRAIQAYVLSRAAASANSPTNKAAAPPGGASR